MENNMPNQLHMDMDVLPNPYFDPASPNGETWGRLRVHIVTENEDILLLDKEWNLDEPIEWFVSHRSDLCHELPPRFEGIQAPTPAESIARYLDRCWATGAELEGQALEVWMDEFREPIRLYRERHALSRAMKGSGVPTITIGCNHGMGEISLSPDEEDLGSKQPWTLRHTGDWSYSFHMWDFWDRFYKDAKTYLREWLQSSTDPPTQNTARRLLLLLSRSVDETSCCNSEEL
ncbi:MAG: hypothetical protein ABI670_16205 [Chloroflexota bacterium]